MSEFDRHDLEVALRYGLASFIQRSFQTIIPAADYLDNWHIDAIAWHLQPCFDGRIRRLIITQPSSNPKSICASCANELTAKHARDCRRVMESAWYRPLIPRTRLNPKKSAELEFETARQGYRYGTSRGGPAPRPADCRDACQQFESRSIFYDIKDLMAAQAVSSEAVSPKFPKQHNREFFEPNREISVRNREFTVSVHLRHACSQASGCDLLSTANFVSQGGWSCQE